MLELSTVFNGSKTFGTLPFYSNIHDTSRKKVQPDMLGLIRYDFRRCDPHSVKFRKLVSYISLIIPIPFFERYRQAEKLQRLHDSTLAMSHRSTLLSVFFSNLPTGRCYFTFDKPLMRFANNSPQNVKASSTDPHLENLSANSAVFLS